MPRKLMARTLLKHLAILFALTFSCQLAKANNVEQLYKQGTEMYAQGRLSDAASCMSSILSTNASYAPAHNLLGKIYYKQHKADLAISEYKLAIKCDARLAEAKYNLGIVYFDQNEYAQAERYLAEACKESPKIAEYEYN